ncbi:MAG: N-acetyl sugar amidotransferase [Chromatiaceae bacterium]|nr:N-acetyl sugar amidotransferase [Chromatiaceae bacterium]
MLSYCKKCILPDTRPNIKFDANGENCNCATAERKASVDWFTREAQFRELVREVQAKGRPYDCVIPVSGGKDSTWQVIKALEYGLKPLCVTWKTPARNELGMANLHNLINLGVNHIDFSINPQVERRFTLKAFERMGSPVIPMHMALHAIPLQIAVNFRIPLILWGENSAYEYGGEEESLKGLRLTHAWLRKYGVTNGTSAEDWIDDDLSEADLAPYFWPSDETQSAAGVSAVFLGHYLRWDPHHTYEVARQHGFRADIRPKTGYYAFADIDDEFLITIHHWLKWYKFGFTRLWDNLSLEIRNNRMTRDQAIGIVCEAGQETPHKEIALFCDYIGICKERFFEIAERFRNHDIWTKGTDGIWRLDGFLIDDWNWHK